MRNDNDTLQKLLDKLENLSKRQDAFSNEINALREEIQYQLYQKTKEISEETEIVQPISSFLDADKNLLEKTDVNPLAEPPKPIRTGPPEIPGLKTKAPPKTNAEYEHFIGSNIINKIGIAITIIGVAIGAKYSIDHELISPMTRILLGYAVGIGLLGFGLKLKKAYTDYSAVLVSGAIAIMYFITYAAFSFYSLFPQVVAFVLMIIFTIGTVAAAMNYNRQVIAHIGLVGAYAVPFLLSNDYGNVSVLYTYMAIINIGILIIAIRKYWKPLYYSSFILTWMIFSFWYGLQYVDAHHFNLFWIFAFVFFITFYLIFISYKLLHQEKFKATDVLLILANSFIFYGLGYSALTDHHDGSQLLGLFTLANALIHMGVTLFIYTRKAADRNLFTMVAGLVLIFITIAVPVQLDGSWVTLLWTGEAVLLFWIGRIRNDSIYERISYAMMFLAFFSIIGDWMVAYQSYDPAIEGTRIAPLINIHFLTSMLFIVSFAFLTYLNRDRQDNTPQSLPGSLTSLMRVAIPAILLFAIYFSFRIEITTYWDQRYLDSSIIMTVPGTDYPTTFYNEDLTGFKEIWTLNYSLLFFSLLGFVNMKIIRNKQLAMTVLAFGLISMIFFLAEGQLILNQLRDSYLQQDLSGHYPATHFNMIIRYISFAFAGLMLFVLHRTISLEESPPHKAKLSVAFDLLFHLSVLIVLSNEWITWMTVLNYSESTRLGLSIVWGIYALGLIILGIWKSKQHLRIGAILLFAVTLIKLTFYDLSHLNTIAKTVVFVSLGILLLIISFLYNKYKHVTQV